MRFQTDALFFLFVTALVSVGAGQTVPADSDPVLLSQASYSMPQSAIDADIDGSVMVAIRVDETGKPTNAVLVSGPMWPCGSTQVKALEKLASTLVDTMKKLRFAPAIKDGKAITKDVGLRLELKNPKFGSIGPVRDPVTGKPKPTRISSGVINGKAKDLPRPPYPAEARANRDSGAVTIQVLVDEEGKVIRAGALSGAPTLQLAAREAACKARFSRTTLFGDPVMVSGVITYNFVP